MFLFSFRTVLVYFRKVNAVKKTAGDSYGFMINCTLRTWMDIWMGDTGHSIIVADWQDNKITWFHSTAFFLSFFKPETIIQGNDRIYGTYCVVFHPDICSNRVWLTVRLTDHMQLNPLECQLDCIHYLRIPEATVNYCHVGMFVQKDSSFSLGFFSPCPPQSLDEPIFIQVWISFHFDKARKVIYGVL